MSYTPGPWTMMMPREGLCKESSERISIRGDILHVATIHTGGMEYHPNQEAIDNAHLIAAAPELLSALESLTNHATFWQKMGVNFDSRSLDDAKAVIAKAKGGAA